MALPKPEWMKIRSQINQNNIIVEDMLRDKALNTVCGEANCPNINECFAKKTVTFMILGSVCTRNCTFCAVMKGETKAISEDEPQKVAQAVLELKLKHAVITSVTRDDLPDGGAEQFSRVIKSIRDVNPSVTIEVLIPDFKGDIEALKTVIGAKPDVINHNIETVPRLYKEVRPMAIYERSIELLSNAKKINKNIHTKSGIMLGLGERRDEVIEALKDLRGVDCNLLTMGQYLAPSKKHHPVVEYVHPDIFSEYKDIAMDMGFLYVAAAPFVRSSYHAGEAYETVNQN